ncbi:MAG: hypothetical protein C3F15_06410, partial [Holophagae bacterium]
MRHRRRRPRREPQPLLRRERRPRRPRVHRHSRRRRPPPLPRSTPRPGRRRPPSLRRRPLIRICCSGTASSPATRRPGARPRA